MVGHSKQKLYPDELTMIIYLSFLGAMQLNQLSKSSKHWKRNGKQSGGKRNFKHGNGTDSHPFGHRGNGTEDNHETDAIPEPGHKGKKSEIKELSKTKGEAGKKPAGKETGKSAGKEAGKDAGKEAGKDAGKEAGKDAGKGGGKDRIFGGKPLPTTEDNTIVE